MVWKHLESRFDVRSVKFIVGSAWSGSISNRDSTSDLSSSSSDQHRLKDSSTRCNDFQWILKDRDKSSSSPKMEEQIPQTKPPINRASSREKNQQRKSAEKGGAPGSLDRRRHHVQNRHERDQKSRSSHVIKSPPRFDDYLPPNCQSWCCNPHAEPPPPPVCYENFHRRHERIDPQRYGSSPMLMEHRFMERGSHSDIYSDCGSRYRYDAPSVGCCSSYHMAPPCCFFGESRNYHWTPPPAFLNKPQEQDERYRKLQSERDNLQLQVQVLSEQIEAQTDKIADLEKSLSEKKQQLINTEDMLQREMLSRSSLETQKLELMSAMSELKLQHAELERELVHLRSSQFNNNSSFDSTKKSQYLPRISPQPHHTSTPVHHLSSQNIRVSPSPSPLSGSLSASPRKIDSSSMQQDVQPPKTPPATYRRQIDLQYSSLPRQQFLSNGGTLGVVDSNANPADGARKGVAFGRGLSSLLGGRARGHSVPNLAETEKIVIEDVNDTSQSPSLQFNKNKGIKKIFGKLKRSGSGNLDDLPGIGEFQRGGVRATAAGRLGCNEQSQKPNKPFEEWDIDDVCNWLQDLNLDQYTTEAKRWGKTGKELHETSINEIEKELGIKNPLHRKKLQLALVDVQENGSSDPYLSKAGKLDMAWVLRWLDDTGLPQYKESFLMNKIDGRVLHRLTMDDLGLLHITSLLHVASLKRGIQVLRENNYEAGCLQRRSLPEDPTQPTPKQISLWTTHRVMEWLKAVDLAEYAPNLRGSGVHGGLMVLENKFTAELLASLLSIPPGKTLLRRHLNTHFKELLGKDIIQAKREAEGTLGYIPLTPSSKIKVTKKSHFSLKRNKSKSEADYGDLVCPINALSDDDEGRSKGRGCLSAR
ncbi:SAM domain (Sterile alpha motif) [Popillia japonica]|uniref:SAM domain (Sterile alpha motif) n=1 Tax=Popillia japonica TaxID=7064 RepID=A0AAW1KKM8_POPJA